MIQESRDKVEEFIREEYIDNPDMASPTLNGGIRDLITDIMHLCDKYELDFDDRISGAREVYEDELLSELQQKTGQLD